MITKGMLAFVVVSLLLLQSISAINVGSPIKAIYVDWHLNWNQPQQSVLDAVSAGYNVIIISFYLSGGDAADMAQAWAALDDATKQSTVATAHSKGAVVTVSMGGSTDSPYDKAPYQLGQQVGKWAQSQYLDGVDFDLENLQQGFKAGGMTPEGTVAWISNLTMGTYDQMGKGVVISHAPQGPYFGPVGDSTTWAGTTGGYTGVYKMAANAITFFNVQFYNQGATCYADYNGLFVSSGGSCPVFPKTAVAEIAAAGVPMSKIVVGKPITSADASNGWVDGGTLGGYFKQAQGMGWNTGVMGWVWNDAGTCQSWVQAIYGGSSNSGVNGTSVASSSASATTGSSTSTSGSSTGGSCSYKNGIFCISATQFQNCPGGHIGSCGSGTVCCQISNTVFCGFPNSCSSYKASFGN